MSEITSFRKISHSKISEKILHFKRTYAPPPGVAKDKAHGIYQVLQFVFLKEKLPLFFLLRHFSRRDKWTDGFILLGRFQVLEDARSISRFQVVENARFQVLENARFQVLEDARFQVLEDARSISNETLKETSSI